MQEPWHIKLFGWLRAERDGQTVSRFPTQRAAALLAILAYRRGQSLPRDVLTEMLWPEADPDAARNRFRVTLNALRRVLEPAPLPAGSVLVADRDTVRLSAEAASTDVAEFEELLAMARPERVEAAERASLLARATSLCTSELLSGFYEDWITFERERLACAAVEALGQLADIRQVLGDLPAALDAARRAASMDPCSEAAHQRLMALYLALGEPAQALRQYRTLRRILRREIGQPPSPATRAIAENIRIHLRSRVDPSSDTPPPDADAASSDARASDARASDAEAARPGAPHAGPHLQPPPSHRLPAPITRFFGREGEMDSVGQVLGDGSARLVTLTGPGGSGKTRLAIEIAARLEEPFRGAVWFVSLAEQDDPDSLAGAVFDALHLHRVATLEPIEQVVSALGHAPSLLVLDNFERLVDGGAAFVRELLERVPSLRCLVTSQVRLQVAGEREFPIAPLPVPDGAGAPERLAEVPSVRLFVDRAMGVRPDFQVTEGNAEAVAALCRRLEGIPLAIELAAAWAHTLTPAQMLERLANRFDLLVARGSDVSNRHRTLRTAIDWSFNLLSDDLRRFFIRLAVFRNGWTLFAAQEVCDEPLALDHVATLRERSLLVAEECHGEMCFSMLETLHEYAAEQLPEDDARALGRRHAAHYRRLAEEAADALRGPGVHVWLERLERQHDNLRAALDFSLGPDGDPSVASRLGAALAGFWEFRGHFQEGRRYLALALENETAPGERLKALNAMGRLTVCQGDATEGRVYAEEALALAQRLGDTADEAMALRNLAFSDYIVADFHRSLERQERSLELYRDLGDVWGMAASLDDIGSVLGRTGDYQRARDTFMEALRLYRELEHREGIASALFGLGVLARDLGELGQARRLLDESLAIGREMKDTLLVALAVNSLGTIAAMTGDADEGREKLTESTALFRELRDRRGLFFGLYHLAIAVERHMQPDRASELLREGLLLASQAGDRRYALYAVDGLAVLAADAGEMERAARLFGWSESERQAIRHPWPPFQAKNREPSLDAARTALGESRFTDLCHAGAAMAFPDAIALALSGTGHPPNL